MIPRGVAPPASPSNNAKGAPCGAPFFFGAAISALAQSNPGIRVILRFPNPIETKTSPKSWRRLSLLDLADGVLVDANNKRRHHQMATNDGFPPDDHVPFFLSEHAEQTGQPDIGNALDRATFSSRILKTSISAVTATAIGIAIVSMGDPVALVANVTATWVDKSTLQPDSRPQPAPTIQSIAGTQDLPTTTSDAPARDEIAAAVEPADQSQPEKPASQLTEALFKQFQAWADEEDTRAQAGPATARASCPCTGGARCPNPGPAREEAPTGPVRAKCTRRDPAPAKSSSKDPGRKCTDTDRASTGRPSAGAASAK